MPSPQLEKIEKTELGQENLTTFYAEKGPRILKIESIFDTSFCSQNMKYEPPNILPHFSVIRSITLEPDSCWSSGFRQNEPTIVLQQLYYINWEKLMRELCDNVWYFHTILKINQNFVENWSIWHKIVESHRIFLKNLSKICQKFVEYREKSLMISRKFVKMCQWFLENLSENYVDDHFP